MADADLDLAVDHVEGMADEIVRVFSGDFYVVSILRVQRGRLDRRHLDALAAAEGLTDLLRRADADAERR